jgi:uncharacterized protein YbjT (DUF2867 family)
VQADKKIAVAGGTGRVGRYVVEVLREAGYQTVPMSRATGVDVTTGAGLAEALQGVDTVVDAATGPSPDQAAATEFFTTAARNLQAFGARAGVRQIVVVSIIGCDHFTAGYGAAKVAHEKATCAGPVAGRIVRAAQFHEFVGQLIDWGRHGEVAFVPKMRTQLVAARTVAEELVRVALDGHNSNGIVEVAGPREESLVEMAKLLVARRGETIRIEGVVDEHDPDHDVNLSGALLPGPKAILGGPTFEEWLAKTQ